MTYESNVTSGAFHGLESGGRASQARAALIQGLEQIRALFHRHLEAIEALARERARSGSQDNLEQEGQLRQKAAELEHAQIQMQSRVDRWERERQAMVEKLDHDRRLLAEAWERLEREQIKNVAAAPEREKPAAVARATPLPMTLSLATGHDQPVTEEILRQFQSLRRDVRRNAAAGCSV